MFWINDDYSFFCMFKWLDTQDQISQLNFHNLWWGTKCTTKRKSKREGKGEAGEKYSKWKKDF